VDISIFFPRKSHKIVSNNIRKSSLEKYEVINTIREGKLERCDLKKLVADKGKIHFGCK
jgi:hypothetical protein